MIRILLVEDNDNDARITESVLKIATRESFMYTRVVDLASAILACDNTQAFDVVLLDLSLPDSSGLTTFTQFNTSTYGCLPVVILSGLSDPKIATEAVKMGAQDYITKDELIPGVICRSLRYAIERHKSSEEHLHRSKIELETARQKLIEIADSLHTKIIR
mgnify:CR=1 FL=1